jgi:two-component system sensor histidine kinase/response regulator
MEILYKRRELIMEKKIILIADCSYNLMETAESTFNEEFRLVRANTLEDAHELAKVLIPDLIIIGFLYPRGDAFHLHNILREDPSTDSIPLIVVDAPLSEKREKGWTKTEGMQMNAEGYLVQPIEWEQLQDEVIMCLNTSPRTKEQLENTLKKIEFVLSCQLESWKEIKNKLLAEIGK